MKIKFKNVLVFGAILIFCLLALKTYGQEPGESNKLLDTLDAQIEKATEAIDKKQEQQQREKEEILTKLKSEAAEKQIRSLYKIANEYTRQKKYNEAKNIYAQILQLDPASKTKVEAKMNFCESKIKAQEEKLARAAKKQEDALNRKLAKDLVKETEEKTKCQKGTEKKLKITQVKKYIYLGNEYFEQKNYPLAVEAYENALMIDPANEGVMNKLAKARMLYAKEESQKAPKAEEVAKKDINYNTAIRGGFKQIAKYLEDEDYEKAYDEFAKILENVDNSNIESLEKKTVQEIKQSARKGPEEIISYLREDKYDIAKSKIRELMQKTAILARQREEKEKEEKHALLVNSYLQSASEYLENRDYVNARAQLQKAVTLDPENGEAKNLLERVEDIIAVTAETR